MTGPATTGRRVGSMGEITMPGDYFGPVRGFTGELEACFFLKPHARDPDATPRARSIQHVCFGPGYHAYRECPDGSLEIRPSISNLTRRDTAGESDDGWHGWLNEGHQWQQVPV